MITPKDILGREIKVGDVVAYAVTTTSAFSSCGLQLQKVTGFKEDKNGIWVCLGGTALTRDGFKLKTRKMAGDVVIVNV